MAGLSLCCPSGDDVFCSDKHWEDNHRPNSYDWCASGACLFSCHNLFSEALWEMKMRKKFPFMWGVHFGCPAMYISNVHQQWASESSQTFLSSLDVVAVRSSSEMLFFLHQGVARFEEEQIYQILLLSSCGNRPYSFCISSFLVFTS